MENVTSYIEITNKRVIEAARVILSKLTELRKQKCEEIIDQALVSRNTPQFWLGLKQFPMNKKVWTRQEVEADLILIAQRWYSHREYMAPTMHERAYWKATIYGHVQWDRCEKLRDTAMTGLDFDKMTVCVEDRVYLGL